MGMLWLVNFEQYLKLIAKLEVWINQYQMCVLSERTGIPTVVWHFCSKKLTWLRAALTPWWKQEAAQISRKQKPIVLARREKQDRAMLPDSEDEVEVPIRGWLMASLPNSVGSLLGAGDGPSLPTQGEPQPLWVAIL